MTEARGNVIVPEAQDKLITIDRQRNNIDSDLVVASLRDDLVVLIREASPESADRIVRDVAGRLGLGASLELQATYASVAGHRHNIGKFFMSVNSRQDCQFVPPHSEGGSVACIQLAAFLCYENSTDGGETILMRTDESSELWQSLRELKRRVKPTAQQLSPREIAQLKGRFQIRFPEDVLRDDDVVLREQPSTIAGVTLVDVLARHQKTHSRILGRDLFVYWDTVGRMDSDAGRACAYLMSQWGLLKQPGGLEESQMDYYSGQRTWKSGVDHAQLFKCRITRKLAPGDFIILNNMAWTHAVSNWRPGSGTRKVAACFA